MDLRPVADVDLPFLAEMTLLAAFPAGVLPDGASEMPHVTRWTAAWGREGDAGEVAWVNGRRVGAAWCRIHSDMLGRDGAGDPTPEIAIAVDPSHRSRGIGSQMVAALVREAARAGLSGLCLAVNERNRALRLYVGAGRRRSRRRCVRRSAATR